MKKDGRFAGFELVHLLFLLTTAELAFNRLATRELRPPPDTAIPWWHQLLDHLALFSQYFASILALAIVGYHLWRLLRRKDLYWPVARIGLLLAGIPFLLFGTLALLTALGPAASFWFETAFIAMVLFLVVAQIAPGGDLGVKIDIVLLVTPLVVHYYGLFSLRVISGEEALWSDLPERVLLYGQWTMILSALLSPYCLAPRPFFRNMSRPGPIVIAMSVCVLCILLLRQHYEVAMRLAENWLGFDIGPGAPATSLMTYAFAVGTVTWTMTACVTADSIARRDIGVGLGLIVVSGYGFAWPVQFLVSMVGFLTIAESARKVVTEEREIGLSLSGFRAPPIADAVWQEYVRELAQELGTGLTGEDGEGPGQRVPASAVTVYGEDENQSLTHIVTLRHGIDAVLRIERYRDSVIGIHIACGGGPDDSVEPEWTLYARPERLLGIGAHPEPPATSAPVRKIGDPSFEQRFRVRDAGDFTELLMTEDMRASAVALLDGWVAYWPGSGLHYRVLPGRGAPLDHPIPITELAFRGAGGGSSPERLVSVLDLLTRMALRAQAAESA